MAEVLLSNETLEVPDLNINDAIDKQEAKTNIGIALGILKSIDARIKNFDLNMTFDTRNHRFYFIVGTEKLNIPMSVNEIQYYGEALNVLLNFEGNLGIAGKKDFRRIFDADSWSSISDSEVFYRGTQFRGRKLNIEEARFNNNTVEELYKFVQTLKGVPKEEWVIKNGIGTPDTIGF